MRARTYCCCAVPMYNTGIYTIIAQFAVISLVTGILSLAAPKIVSVAVPSFGGYILGACCILVALIQVFGFFGVYRERPSLYRQYALWNMLAVLLALGVALAFIILSCVRHSTALASCEGLFATATTTVAQNSAVCNIWMWVQVGLMGLLWIIVAIAEVYFVMLSYGYAKSQRLDHAKYDSVFETVREEIRQSGIYSTDRPSTVGSLEPLVSSTHPQPYAAAPHHGRQNSGLRHEIDMDHEDKMQSPGSYLHPSPLGYELDGGVYSHGEGYVEAQPYGSLWEPTNGGAYQDEYQHGGGYAGHGYAASAVSGYQDASLPKQRNGPNVLHGRRY
ncbi:BZ3500_MvSof-1268-A1-R1_Chr7-3g09661 [Microbotryum saponariae]|uniref:BZ3500_MvSof-1268-A1-R1_Chr7-3g09661 protein n=1 Tax=Microbotryum saponariae TaxID=289078 RepID=A0A2X0KUY3_9BASI|nr:BZ3501_MvSof-1269-A2-R1_Chr7-2g09384 [Microbotryum saponariae]SDA02367.1 BZ3500_MvSof-1268-A1-R1_Chr7-3g09661 [Microbotryum saponariae]